jgi:hypothetical protein
MMTAGNLSLSGASDIVVAVFEDNNGGGTMSPGSGFTQEALDTTSYSIVEDRVVGPDAGNIPPTAFLPGAGGDGCWVAAAAAFKAL